MSKIDISKIQAGLVGLAEKYPIKFVVLFGLAGRGEAGSESDIDVAVFLDSTTPSFSHPAFDELLNFLAKACGVREDKIDLSDLRRADSLLRYEITKEGILLYGDDLDYENFCVFAFKDYLDTKPLRVLEEDLLKKRQYA